MVTKSVYFERLLCTTFLAVCSSFICFSQNKPDTVSINFKDEKQIHKELIEAAVAHSIEEISNSNTDFAVKQTIISTFPIKSKIGKKEGLRVDDLFAVKEIVLDTKTNTKKFRTVGYVRAKKVANNAFDAQGNSTPSVFYKSPSGIIKKGMSIQEIKEKGFTLGVSYHTTSTSLIGGYFINGEYITHWIPGFRIGLDVGYNPSLKTTSVGGQSNVGAFSGQSFTGILSVKQNINFNRISFTPLAGIYYSYAPLSASDVVPYTDLSLYPGLKTVDLGAVVGGDVGINFNKTLQLHGGIRKQLSLGGGLTNSSDGTFPLTLDYDDITMVLGLRFKGF